MKLKELMLALILISSSLTIVQPEGLIVNRTYFIPGETLKVYASISEEGKKIDLMNPNGKLVAEVIAKPGLSLEYTFSKEDPPGEWTVKCSEEEKHVYLLSPGINESFEFPPIPPKIEWIRATPPNSSTSSWNVSVGVYEFNGIPQLRGVVVLKSPDGRTYSSPLKFTGKVSGIGTARVRTPVIKGEWKIEVDLRIGNCEVKKEISEEWAESPPSIKIELDTKEVPCYVTTFVKGMLWIVDPYNYTLLIQVVNGSKVFSSVKARESSSACMGFALKVKLDPGEYDLKVTVEDPFGNWTSYTSFEAVDYPPQIEMNVTPRELPFGYGRQVNLSLEVKDPNNDVESVILELISPNGEVERLNGGGTLRLNFTMPGNWTITCIAKDKFNVREKSLTIYAYDLPPIVSLSKEKFCWEMGKAEVHYRIEDPNGDFDLKSAKLEVISPEGEKEVEEIKETSGNFTFYAKEPGIWEVKVEASDMEGKTSYNLTFLRVLGYEGIGVENPQIEVEGEELIVGTFLNIGDVNVTSIYVNISGVNFSEVLVLRGGEVLGKGKGEIRLRAPISPGESFVLEVKLLPPLRYGEHRIKVEVLSG